MGDCEGTEEQTKSWDDPAGNNELVQHNNCKIINHDKWHNYPAFSPKLQNKYTCCVYFIFVILNS